MSPILAPPRPEDLDRPASEIVDPEALIKEARRRARRRRVAHASAALLMTGAALGAFFAFRGGASSPPRYSGPGSSNRGLPAAAAIRGTTPLSAGETVLFSARAGSLFVLVVPSGRARAIVVMRLRTDGAAIQKRVPFDQPAYLMDISTGQDGVYAGTAVIKRFTTQPDELVRIDARTLTIAARAKFPSSVAAVEQGGRMWASIGDGRVVRLDPRTLTIEASRRFVSSGATAGGGASTLSKPAFGLGSLWVLTGNASNRELVRLDPASLTVRSRTRIPARSEHRAAMSQVVADVGHVYLLGSAIVAVDRHGRLEGRPLVVPGLATAGIQGTRLVGLTGGKPAIVLLNENGRIVAKTSLADAGGNLAVSGDEAWFLGNAGQGNGIVHVQLAAP